VSARGRTEWAVWASRSVQPRLQTSVGRFHRESSAASGERYSKAPMGRSYRACASWGAKRRARPEGGARGGAGEGGVRALCGAQSQFEPRPADGQKRPMGKSGSRLKQTTGAESRATAG
jgi:hypothetical protein